jgi:hypothetical protein
MSTAAVLGDLSARMSHEHILHACRAFLRAAPAAPRSLLGAGVEPLEPRQLWGIADCHKYFIGKGAARLIAGTAQENSCGKP